MFKHPIRDLAVLSLGGYLIHRAVAKRGGWSKLWSRTSAPFSKTGKARTAR